MNAQELALIAEGKAWTFAALRAEARRLVQQLAAFGVRAGDRVGMLLPNTPQAVFLIHAVHQLGAVLVPLNVRLTVAELKQQVRRVALRCLVHDATTALQAAALAPEAPLLDLSTADAPRPADLSDLPTSAYLHTLVFTSGTTGTPKAAMLTWGNHVWSAIASGWRLGVQRDDRWLLCLPLYHVGGLAVVLRAALYGIPIVLHARFDAEAVLASLARDRATLISLVPTMLKRLLDANGDRPLPEHVRLVLLGGAAAPAPLLERALAARVPVALTYGLTEAASQVATATPEQVRAAPGSVGHPLRSVRVRVADEHGEAVPTGAIGELWVRGPVVMRGYWGDAEATARALTPDGWLRTGDLGYFDEAGRLWVVQRRTDLILSGGENVYPAEVEAVLLRHPAVEAACVVGVEDAEWGQRVVALVQRAPHAQVEVGVLQAFCREHLAGYKCPRAIWFVDALPLTASGKVDRKAAQAWAAQRVVEQGA